MQDVFLCRPKNDIELYLYEELLRKHSVPYLLDKKTKPCGEIHVSPEHLEKAMEITRIIPEEQESSAEERMAKDRSRKRLAFAIVLLFIIVPIAYLLARIIL